jgi:NAD(P)-dependent dehydrogenase (short-subunit alcohol dehydrogenase family)
MAGSIGDGPSGGNYGYRMSKAALNLAAANLAHELRPRGIHVVVLHPGFVQTDMTSGRGNVHPSAAAAGLIERIDELDASGSGRFFHADGRELPW